MAHIQVLLKNNIVIAELVLVDDDPVVMQETFDKFDYDQVIDTRRKEVVLAGLGASWDGKQFNIKPYPSWILNDQFQWEAPKPKPDGDYNWDDNKQTWVVTTNPDNESGCIDCDN